VLAYAYMQYSIEYGVVPGLDAEFDFQPSERVVTAVAVDTLVDEVSSRISLALHVHRATNRPSAFPVVLRRDSAGDSVVAVAFSSDPCQGLRS
jgi:hypothetical protein